MKFDARDWPAISALLDQALEVPAAQRARWLGELAADQARHRGTIEHLLEDHARVQTRDFLGTLPKVSLAEDPGVDSTGPGGRTVGVYRLQRELGRGGMGSVWLAERIDGLLKRPVALKLPHPALATSAFADRLERERDILASLSHPHIARLYDAGVTPDGQPYLALEYVEGMTLIEHCVAKQLGTRARIELFLQVLDAVQYAHARLVIHRDLKPSNVLVDEQGQAQLLDFGIAKLLVDGQAEATELTLDAGQALTPDYASPEQIAGAAVSTASDVYSLGVLLFEMLVGTRPYRLTRTAAVALTDAIAATDVGSPSSAARAAGDAVVARSLRGDLDTIVLKALKKDPAARYATVDAFAQDLRRHLDGAPVLARPDTVAYRVGTFVRRHRFGVAAGGVLVIALAAGLAGTAWQARRATQQAERAQAVQEFLIGLFDESDPAKAQGHELTARQMLDRGQRDLLVKLAAQPRLHELLDGVLVDLYVKLNDEAKALPLAEARRDLALKLDGPQSTGYGDALYGLGRVQGGLAHHQIAYDTYLQARTVLTRHADERAGELLMLEEHLATQLMMLDRTKQALDVVTPLTPRIEAHFGSTSWEFVQTKAVLASIYADLREAAKTAEVVAQLTPLLDRVDPSHEVDAAQVRGDLGYAMWSVKEYAAAEPLLVRSIADADRLLGRDNTTSLSAQRTLGLALDLQGRFRAAAETFDDSVQRAVRLQGEDSAFARFAESFDVLPLVMLGQYREAVAMGRRSVRGMDHVDGITPAVARGFDRRLGLALVTAGDGVEATRLLQDVLSRDDKAGIKSGPARSQTLRYLAGAWAAQGRHDMAAMAAIEAAKVLPAVEPNSALPLARAKLIEALARAHLHQGPTALALVDEGAAVLETSPVVRPVDRLLVELVRAEALRSDGAEAEADRLDRSVRERLLATADVVMPRPLVIIP